MRSRGWDRVRNDLLDGGADSAGEIACRRGSIGKALPDLLVAAVWFR